MSGITDSSVLLLGCMYLLGCINSTEKSSNSSDISGVNPAGYNLSDPDRTIVLPPALLEISGITIVDSSSVACVQDENGIIFIVDLRNGAISDQFIFHLPGDYEGIARAGNTIYVLRSDGVLFGILFDGSSGSLKKSFSVKIPPNDYEGLCYDSKNNRLLIMPKNRPGKDSENEGIHPVYGFDLGSETLFEEPVISVSLKKIQKFADENKIHASAQNSKIRFKPSAIGIHPLTNKLYVLSAVERILFIFDMNGKIEYIENLAPEIFNKPEGISFFGNGDMLISNEGLINPPTILTFNYKGK